MNLKNILVVDDEEMIRDLCSRVLANEGYHAKLASNGEEAVEIASSEEIQVAVIDLVMPGMDGLETFLALREGHPEIVGVLITGHGTIDIAIQAMKLGFSGFFRKPFTPTELVEAVKDTFRKVTILEEYTRLKTLIPLYKLGEKFISSETEDDVHDELIKAVSHQTVAQRLSIMRFDETQGCLTIAAARGIQDSVVKNSWKKSGEKIAGWVFQSGQPVILNGGPQDNPEFAPYLKRKEIIAAISFPLKGRDSVLGVLNVSKTGEGSPFSKADIEMLSVICGQAVMALENLRVMEEKAEKVRVRTLFEQYVAPEVAELLISHSQKPMELGEIKDISVLFADIRNFTPLVQQLPLETLRSFLNEFFNLLTEVVFWHKGTLDKFMGDAVLAFFGAPVSLNNSQNAAVSAAIEMVKIFSRLKEIWTATNQPLSRIGLGIGIGSGEMFLGNVGSLKRFDYTVIGTDVNLAQRLSSEAASGEILITQSVKETISSQFRTTIGSTRKFRGLDKPIPVFSVITTDYDFPFVTGSDPSQKD